MSSWSGPEGQSADRPIHVVPNNDLRQHDTESSLLCPCMPRDKDGVIIHNSYDRREVGEVMRLALSDLPTHYKMQDAYKHAIHLLDMHWPKVTG